MTDPKDYSEFASFDPDHIRASESSSASERTSLGLPERSSRSPESLERPSSSDRNGDEAATVWDRKRLAELVNFEEDGEPRSAKKSDSPGAEKDATNNIVSRDELFEFDPDDPNQSKTERTFSNSPWTKGGLVGMGAMVVFVGAGLFLNNVFNRGKVAQAPPTPTPTPALTPAPTPAENETGKLKTEIALGTQAEQLAALNRAKSPSNLTPTPTATPSPSLAPTATNTSPNQAQTSTPTPTRTAKPVVSPPANNTPSPAPRVIVREVVKRVPVPVPVPQPAPVRQVPIATNRPAPVPVALDRPARQIVRSAPPLRSAQSPAPAPTIAPTPTPRPPAVQPKEPTIAPTPRPTRATEASPQPDPFAQWQALASVGSYGQADVPGDDSQEVAAVPVPSQQAEPAMPGQIGVSPVPVSAYPYTVMPPAAPGAYSPGEQVAIAAAERSSIALPKAVRVIADPPAPYTNQGTSNDAAEESLLLNGSRSPAAQPQPEVAAINPEESLLLNGSASTVAQTNQSPDLVAANSGMQAVDAEEDVLMGRVPQQPPLSLRDNSPALSGQYLQVGTSASGKLITPVLNPSGVTTANTNKYANNPSNPNAQRFAVQLTSPLLNAYGQPIVNPGTLIVFTVASVAPNGWVDAIAESVVFSDGREYRLPPGAIGIRGDGGKPLIAKKWDDKSREIFSQDANAFLFGALSNVGRVLNQPRSESYEYNSGFGFGLGRRSIERNSPNVLGAVLSGGFAPVLESIMQRNAMAMQEMRQRPNIWYVSAGKEVQIFVNQSFQF
ncbi:hypothetical protein H6S82_00085 [Planktothrix sp. FACHB-1355]|uniref:Uncharacterized protein n=1 Tax=Aerosakkonema funiforme FACHB-1375 TaxID=2949571 RepID=A0A926ZIJ5_9CYAN|nr:MULTISPECIES: TrbI/VirB10 family protein [Oscillatoriales]MBD2181851.1 hypothetical protein [Aerosakkonema funiforme FACHB-1375]MBD3557271.1 hypothetical protein [Planktothrix sp. FACHB-1355]